MFPSGAGPPWIVSDSGNHGYWLAQSLDASTTVDVEATDSPGFSRVSLVFDRTTPTGLRDDVIVCGLSWAERASTAVSPLGTADKSAIETALNTWYTSWNSALSNQLSLREYRWYDYEPINSRPGPVDRVTARGVAGGMASARAPDQMAMTQTFKTASRKHWGRWYLPFPGVGNVSTTYGRIGSAIQTTLQASTRTLLQTTGSTGLACPVVASISYKGVLGIKELQSDDIVDVIRSRRAKQPFSRLTNTS